MSRALVWLGALALAGAGAFEAWVAGTVLPPLAPPVSAEVHDRAGRLLRAWPVEDGRWRLATTRADVDRAYLDRLIAYEDRRFWRHAGVDWLALGRAGAQALAAGRVVSGGSTLTMQVARLLEGAPTGSVPAKLRQIRLALALERRLDKGAVLDLYLTLAPFGGNVEGVRAAAWAWFGREPKGLSPAEAALLVALPQAPEARRPDRHPAAARAARDRVLARTLPDPRAAAVARAAAVPARRHAMPMLAAHATEAARAAGQGVLALDAPLQARLEVLLRARVAALPVPLTAALVVAEHGSGAVRALVGAPDVLDAARFGAVDMAVARRSPGSALKPLIYGLGFEAGLIHPETLVADRPTDFGGWAPRNIDRGFQGDVPVRAALQQSLNVPAVAVLEALGPAALVARLRRAGVTLALPPGAAPGLPIALGGGGVSLMDLAALYAAIGRGGEAVALSLAEPVAGPPPRGAPVLAPRAAWQVAEVLAGAPPPAGASLAPGVVAWKTGTAWGHRDAWAAGFDGRHVVAVWVGRADGGAVPGMMAREAAAPLLFEAFARLGVPLSPLPPRPADLPALTHAELPPGLRRFGPAEAGPRIAYPPDGARVAVGFGPEGGVVALKVGAGVPPFTWLVDGRPLAADPFARAVPWRVPGPGFATITLVDGRGQASHTKIQLE